MVPLKKNIQAYIATGIYLPYPCPFMQFKAEKCTIIAGISGIMVEAEG